MAGLAYTKPALKKELEDLELYRQYLPALELKRQQLVLEARRAREALERTAAAMAELREKAAAWLPFLGNPALEIQGIAKVREVELGEESILGMKLPLLGRVEIEAHDPPRLARPLWIDALTTTVARGAELEVRLQVERKRVQLIEHALQRLTQRVNLFGKVLIPAAARNIRLIRIALGDAERAEVIRAKMGKRACQKNRPGPIE